MIKEFLEIKHAAKKVRTELQNRFFGYDIKVQVTYRKHKRAIVRIDVFGHCMEYRYGLVNEIRFVEWRAIKEFWHSEVINDFLKRVELQTIRVSVEIPHQHVKPFVKIPPI